LFGKLDALGFFDGFEGGEEMGNGAGATNTREERRNGDGRFAADGGGVETAIVLDNEFKIGDLAVFDFNFEAGRAFDFGDFVDGDVA